MQGLTTQRFQTIVYDYYEQHGRHDLPWRLPRKDGSFDPYHILVSELMLQQTQVSRVIPKYDEFLVRFPTLETLAQATLGDVLRIWNGLGYNRRARYVHQAAQQILATPAQQVPRTIIELTKLSGVGMNTAGAILAYAYNKPAVFVETNIRTVLLHHYFSEQSAVTDTEIRDVVRRVLDGNNPRTWYWALMDYGSHLKRQVGGSQSTSAAYRKQQIFNGSRRQLRGQVIRLLTSTHAMKITDLQQHIHDERLADVLDKLVHEGLIQRTTRGYQL